MGSLMEKLLPILILPLIIINLLGGVISGIWLAIIGEWWALGYGILGLFISQFIIGLAMLPGLIFAGPGAIMLEKNKTILGSFFLLLSNLYNAIVLTIWCGGIFYLFMAKADADSWIPLLIWSYGVATGPINYLAQKEQQGGSDSPASLVASLFAQLGYISMIISVVVFNLNIIELMIVFAGVMLIGSFFMCVMAIAAYMEAKRFQRIYD